MVLPAGRALVSPSSAGVGAAPGTAEPIFHATEVFMDTLVAIDIVGRDSERQGAVAAARAYGWFREVEARCSRFDAGSELMQLCASTGQPMPVSPLLYEVLDFAIAVARASGGAFDPTIGATMRAAGFNRNYQTGLAIEGGGARPGEASYRDVHMDRGRRMVALGQPLTLDLGAVAKGLAIDLAARELEGFAGFAINAGGDILAGGLNASAEPWRIGIRHPRNPRALVDSVRVSGAAVCTSGDYERAGAAGVAHHILDPKTGRSSARAMSVTTIAPSAMLADALGTAAFVLGPEAGIALLEAQGIDGLIVDEGLAIHTTKSFARHRA